MLLVEGITIDAVGVPPHGEGPVLNVGQHHRGDLDVVIDEVPLGETGFGEENLVEIRHRESSRSPTATCVSFLGTTQNHAPFSLGRTSREKKSKNPS